MSTMLTSLACAQCGQAAPSYPPELMRWSYGSVAVSGDYSEVIDRLLLCPECVEEEHAHEFDEGGMD
jgi:hypothetical protein